jgi:hypothetical protein
VNRPPSAAVMTASVVENCFAAPANAESLRRSSGT